MKKQDKSDTDEVITQTSIKGLYIVNRLIFPDHRGFFREIFRLNELEEKLGFKFKIIQANHSRSIPGVIRALHAENWNKLVYPINGKVFTAVVDIRPDSETFGKVQTFDFDDESRKALFIPKGLANSVCVDGDNAVDYLYLVDAYYDGKDTRAVAWDDPDLNIVWPVKNPIVSDRDRANPRLRDLFPDKFKK